jgi:hypothetical protein
VCRRGCARTRPPGLPHSLWELLEHLRRCQWDVLDYCGNPKYREGKWPDDYWPDTAEPPGEAEDQRPRAATGQSVSTSSRRIP